MIGFDRQAAEGLTATFALRVRSMNGRRPRTLLIEVDEGRLRRGSGQPSATATLFAGDLARLAAGTVGWPELLASGRLELTGDPFLALRIPGLFRLPSASSAPAPRRALALARALPRRR